MRLLELEWWCLSDECKSVATQLMADGINDVEMAVEMAIIKLGEERAFDLGDKGVS